MADPIVTGVLVFNTANGPIKVTLTSEPLGSGFGYLKVESFDGRVGVAQLQPNGDNGNLVWRNQEGDASPIHDLILDDSGVVYEG